MEKPETDGGDERESVVTTQMSTLLALMRQQLEWTMRSETGRREQGIEAAEALETRMRGMEVKRYLPAGCLRLSNGTVLCLGVASI